MRAFGLQKFLNPPHSPDSGWVKFSVRKSTRLLARVTTRTIIADCSQQIELEFDLYGIDTGRIPEEELPGKIASALVDLKARRAKVNVLRDSVNKYCDALLTAYDEAENDLQKALEKGE